MYHVDQQFGVNQRVYWCESTPPKLPDEWCGQIAVDELDNRLARIPRFPGLKIFKNGLET